MIPQGGSPWLEQLYAVKAKKRAVQRRLEVRRQRQVGSMWANDRPDRLQRRPSGAVGGFGGVVQSGGHRYGFGGAGRWREAEQLVLTRQQQIEGLRAELQEIRQALRRHPRGPIVAPWHVW